MTVGELRKFLSSFNDDATIAVKGTPQISSIEITIHNPATGPATQIEPDQQHPQYAHADEVTE
jgi:hypothetical protein